MFYNPRAELVIIIILTELMTSTQVVEMSVTFTYNCPFQGFPYLVNQIICMVDKGIVSVYVPVY